MVFQLRHRTNQASAILIRQLKRRDRRRAKMRKNYDLLTAILQAASLKRRECDKKAVLIGSSPSRDLGGGGCG